MTGAPLVFPRSRRARRARCAADPGAAGELVALPTRAPSCVVALRAIDASPPEERPAAWIQGRGFVARSPRELAKAPELDELEAIGERIGMAAGRLLRCLRDGRRADVEAVIRVAEHVEVYGAAAVAIGGRPALVLASPGCG